MRDPTSHGTSLVVGSLDEVELRSRSLPDPTYADATPIRRIRQVMRRSP